MTWSVKACLSSILHQPSCTSLTRTSVMEDVDIHELEQTQTLHSRVFPKDKSCHLHTEQQKYPFITDLYFGLICV